MPSVGSTPTTTSPASQQQPQPQQLQQPQQTSTAISMAISSRLKPAAKTQQPLQLQLQYQHYQPQQHQPTTSSAPPTVTTTQPTPAGVFSNNNSNNNNAHNAGDISPISTSHSYSSVDTNQTLLNSIANQQQQQRGQRRSHNNKYSHSQFMIITPAVSIDRDFEYEHGCDLDYEDFAQAAHNNGNLFRLGLRRSGSSIDSGHSSDNSFRSNYNPYLHHSRQHLMARGGAGGRGSAPHFYTFSSSWRWCSLICAAMRCFGAGRSSQATYSSSIGRHVPPHQRLRRCSSTYNTDNAYEHFAAPFKARKTRDHMNNITYEL